MNDCSCFTGFPSFSVVFLVMWRSHSISLVLIEEDKAWSVIVSVGAEMSWANNFLTPFLRSERSGPYEHGGGTKWVELLITSQGLRHHFCSFPREGYVTFSCFHREKCHYYALLTIHDTLGCEGRVSNTLWQSFIMTRVFLTKLFQKKKNMSSSFLKRLVDNLLATIEITFVSQDYYIL